MSLFYDYIIIGAGPAGMAAAVTVREYGLTTLVLDEQLAPGGQIYRSIERATTKNAAALGEDYTYGRGLTSDFRHSGAEYITGATVWSIDKNLTVSFNCDNKAKQVKGKRILIATGAVERPVPIPGWTLPGVMGAGAADVLLKSAEIVPAGQVVLAGSGPLLLLVTCHMLENGVEVAGLLETTNYSDYLKALPEIPAALKKSDYLVRGLKMRRQIRNAKVPCYTGVRDLEAIGKDKLESVKFTAKKSHTIEAQTLLLHEGVIANTQMTRMLNCDHGWDSNQRYWSATTDEWGNTNIDGIAVAGDSGKVCGAKIAEACGRLAGLETAHRLQYISRSQRDWAATPHKKIISDEKAIRPLLNRMFPPNPQALVPPNDDTIVCRCEEITAGQIRQSVSLGNHSPGAVKVHTRSGMGPCQGRMCGTTIAEIIADYRKVKVSEIDPLNIRPPVKPVTLGQLAKLELWE